MQSSLMSSEVNPELRNVSEGVGKKNFHTNYASWETVWLKSVFSLLYKWGIFDRETRQHFLLLPKNLYEIGAFFPRLEQLLVPCGTEWLTVSHTHTHTHIHQTSPRPAPWRSRKRLKIGSIKGMLWQGHMRRMYLCKREICSSAFLPLFLMWKFGKEPKQLRSGPFIFL